MSTFRGVLIGVVFSVGPLLAQLSQTTLAAPVADPAYYDELRDVLVCWDYHPGSGGLVRGMLEYDGSAWTQLLTPGLSFPAYPESAAFDEQRRRFVAIDKWNGVTWEWDGATWSNRGPAPIVPLASPLPNHYNCQVAYHRSRQVVMLFSGQLYEWDGVSWTMIPALNTPPVWTAPNVGYSYGPMSYDAMWDKLVLFGGGLTSSSNSPTTFEWDPVIGWIQLAGTTPADYTYAMWFDRQRGTMMRSHTSFNPTVHAIYCRDQARIWTLFQSTGSMMLPGCYDGRNNRFFSQAGAGLEVLADTAPAQFSYHAQGCTPPSSSALSLAAPWTRAWMGQSLAVDAASPASIALLAMGFSDQSYQTVPLPLDLTARGLTNCSLTVAPEATVLGTGSGGHVGFSIAIPNQQGLLGLTFFQQAFALAPGVNPAGLVASDSVRGTVGWYR